MAVPHDVRRADGAVRLARHAMATRFELVLTGGDPVTLRAIGEEALAEIAACEAAISPFVAGSSIARVNREAHARPTRVDPLTFELLDACVELHAATAGAFDVTVGPMMRALGFRGAPPAGGGALAAARAATGMEHVRLDPRASTVRLMLPGMALDVGAIGKGHALDLAAEVLRAHRVESALMHGGTSTVIAIGAPPGADGWRVALGPGSGAPTVVLRDRALSVSSQSGRRAAGVSDGHVLDPRRQPVSSADERPTHAAVIARSARVADAWSTALLVLGPGRKRPSDLDAAWIDARALEPVRARFETSSTTS